MEADTKPVRLVLVFARRALLIRRALQMEQELHALRQAGRMAALRLVGEMIASAVEADAIRIWAGLRVVDLANQSACPVRSEQMRAEVCQ